MQSIKYQDENKIGVDIILLFLGAGASKAFGMPDMKDLTKIAVEELKEHKSKYIIDYIIKQVWEMGFKQDIEAVLSCIDALKIQLKGLRKLDLTLD